MLIRTTSWITLWMLRFESVKLHLYILCQCFPGYSEHMLQIRKIPTTPLNNVTYLLTIYSEPGPVANTRRNWRKANMRILWQLWVVLLFVFIAMDIWWRVTTHCRTSAVFGNHWYKDLERIIYKLVHFVSENTSDVLAVLCDCKDNTLFYIIF